MVLTRETITNMIKYIQKNKNKTKPLNFNTYLLILASDLQGLGEKSANGKRNEI